MSRLQTVCFPMRAVGSPEEDLLITREVGVQTKEAICARVDKLEANTVLVLDFSAVRFIDVSCADEVVVRVLARLEAGEFPDRFIALSNLTAQHRENIEAALKVARKAVLMRERRAVLGELVNSYRQALSKVMGAGAITARELQAEMNYSTINEASTKLTFLHQRCLVGREPFREAVRGGGRQFRYLSLLD